jgi:hypothetical protein
MNRISTTEVLNRLVAICNRSLPMYLSDARPWTGARDEVARDRLTQIVADQKAMVDRLGRMILQRDGVADLGEFPMEFTGQHDLSLEFLLGELAARQEKDVKDIEQCVQQLESDTMARTTALEALDQSKKHLQSLQDLAQQLGLADSTS